MSSKRKAIAARLRKWRESRGLTQTEQAQRYGYSLRQYQRFEAAEAPFPKPLAKLIELDGGPRLT